MSAETLKLYSAHLCDFEPDDVRDVVRTLAMRKRAEGETAFPALGDLVEPLERLRQRRWEQKRAQRERAEQVEYFWHIVRERLESFGEWRYNGATYRSVDEVNQAPGFYKGTLPR